MLYSKDYERLIRPNGKLFVIVFAFRKNGINKMLANEVNCLILKFCEGVLKINTK